MKLGAQTGKFCGVPAQMRSASCYKRAARVSPINIVFNRTDVCVNRLFNRLYKMSENVKVFYLLEAPAAFLFDITTSLMVYYRAEDV